MPPCPKREDLLRLINRDLPDDAARTLASHTDSCAACHAVLSGLAETGASGPAPPEPVALALGTHIGQYSVVRELGRGGMGMVFEAVHERIGQRAAVKCCARSCPRRP